ncbi:MAG: hypothetical protein GY844_09365, partial [Bradyrhizobium sp.]|nr:hypothetical protein [Bradyrhizobium sp.]
PPATLTATTARLVFHVSMDDTNFYILRNSEGTPVSVTVAAANTNKATYLDAVKFAGWRSVKVGTYLADASTAVVQGASRAFSIVCGKVTG